MLVTPDILEASWALQSWGRSAAGAPRCSVARCSTTLEQRHCETQPAALARQAAAVAVGCWAGSHPGHRLACHIACCPSLALAEPSRGNPRPPGATRVRRPEAHLERQVRRVRVLEKHHCFCSLHWRRPRSAWPGRLAAFAPRLLHGATWQADRVAEYGQIVAAEILVLNTRML